MKQNDYNMHPKDCPKCKTEWEEKETIYEFFLNKYTDENKAIVAAANYGCTPDNPKHFGKDVIGIEIQGMYDGISYWECQKCNGTFDRLTMKEVKEKIND